MNRAGSVSDIRIKALKDFWQYKVISYKEWKEYHKFMMESDNENEKNRIMKMIRERL